MRRAIVLMVLMLVAGAAVWGVFAGLDGKDGTAPASRPVDGPGPVAALGTRSAQRREGRATAGRTGPESPPDAAPEPTRPHTFLVLDEARAPIAGVRVEMSVAKGPAAQVAVTGKDGRAQFDVPEDARITLRCAGFATTRVDPDVPQEGEVQTVVLADGRTIAGRIVDAAGAAVAGATVRLDAGGSKSAVHSADDGSFAFDGLSCDFDALFLEADLHGRGGSAWAAPGVEDLRIVIRALATIRGTVTLPDGSPAAGATVRCGVTADAVPNGRFELTGILPGRGSIRASRRVSWSRDAAYVAIATFDAPDGATLENVDVRLGPPPGSSVVVVRVEDAEGRSVPRAIVEAWSGGARVKSKTAEDDGSYALVCGLPPGTELKLTAGLRTRTTHSSPSACVSAVTAPIGESPPPPVLLRLGPPGKLRIRLEDADGAEIPLSRAELHFDATQSSAVPPDGAWPLDPGIPVTLDVRVPGFATRRVWANPPHPPVRELRVRLPAASSVIGRILDQDGTPAPEETAVVVGAPFDGVFLGGSETLDHEGRFEVAGIPGGAGRLQVLDSREDFVPSVLRDVEIAPGATTDVGEIRLPSPRMAVFEGLVVDAAGRAAGGARVNFEGLDGRVVAPPRTSDRGGRFRVRLPECPGIRWTAFREGSGAVSGAVVPDGPRRLRIALAPGGRVRVRRAVADDAYAGLDARVRGAEWWWSVDGVDDPEKAGWALYDGFPAGTIELTRWAGDAEEHAVAEVKVGATVEVTFTR